MLSNNPTPTTRRSRSGNSHLRLLLGMLVVVAVFASQFTFAAPAAAQVDDGRSSVSAHAGAAFEVRRLGGADRYDTSLQIAHELVGRAGGSIEGAVLASGESWLDAAVGASLAGGLDLPLLLVPPGGLRPEALGFLDAAGVTNVYAVGGTEQFPTAVLQEFDDLDIMVERIWDGDASATALLAAELILAAVDEQAPASGSADEVGDSGRPKQPRANSASSTRAVVLAEAGRFAESLAATAFAARARLPLLFTSAAALDENAARFLLDHETTHVVVMSASGALQESARRRLESLAISVVQLGNGGGFALSAAAADFSSIGRDGRFAALTARDCPSSPVSMIGVATGLRPWDALSAAPLLARHCAPLLLSGRHSLSTEANAVLYRALRTGTDFVYAFGGRAAVDNSVLAHAAAPTVPIRVAIVVEDSSSGERSQAIAVLDELGHQRRLGAGSGLEAIDNLTWSPQQRYLAFSGTRDGITGVFVLELATRQLRRITSAQQHFTTAPRSHLDWSADGVRLAMSGYYGEAVGLARYENSEVYVADMTDNAVMRLTRNRLPDRHAGWAPGGDRLLIFRVTDVRGYTGGWWAPLVFSLDVENGKAVSYQHLGIVTDAKWSPDGRRIALATYENLMDVGYGTPRIRIVDSDESSAEPVAASAGYLGTWSPDGCCIAASAGLYRDNTIVIDARSGESRKIAGRDGRDGSIARSQRLGVTFEGWAPDSQRIVAQTASWSQSLGALTEELLLIDVARRTDTPLRWSGIAAGFRFGGFSPAGPYITYAASDLDRSTIQLIIAEARQDGAARVVLDVTDHFAPVKEFMAYQDVVHWSQLEWSEYGIHGVAIG